MKLSQDALMKMLAVREELRVHRTSTILFAASFLEALINHWLVTSLPKEDFEAFEKLSPLEKWTTAPKLIHRGFVLPKDRSPYHEMKELFSRRNAIMHHVPFHSVDGKVIHKGKSPPEAQNEHAMIKKFFELPKNLFHHLIDQGMESDAWGLLVGSGMNMSEFIDRLNSKKDLKPVAAENGDKSPSLC